MSLMQFVQASAHHMPMLADGSVQMIATSPPYFGLRKYAGEQDIEWPAVDYAPMAGLPPLHVPAMRSPLGNENTLEAYIGHMVLCLREWWRVLRDDGIVFLNIADSFNGSGGAGGDYNAGGLRDGQPKFKAGKANGLKPKDLMLVPSRLAHAAQADGWFVRSDIIARKLAPMPESVTDRPTRSHEYIWMLTKRANYFCDMEAVREEAVKGAAGSTFTEGKTGVNGLGRVSQKEREDAAGRNLRDVIAWRPSPFSAAHFATWPESIPTLLIKMGTSERGACPHCGAPWRRVVERETNPRRTEGRFPSDWRANVNGPHAQGAGSGSGALTPTITTLGWQPSCTCRAPAPCPCHGSEKTCLLCEDTGGYVGAFPEPVPCVVLDPFSGSGTTVRAAAKLGRRGIGVDVSAEYLGEVTAARMGDGFQMAMGV